MANQYVAYYRVSTKRQGQSGLGLEAQKTRVAEFVTAQGGEIVRSFTEVESGKKSNRPELTAALAHARRIGATLVVAKLDRLSRNLAFLSALMESKVDFVCVDNPHANRFTIHILAAVAEHEREMISKRTKEALQAAKARGVKLGSAREGFWDDPERVSTLKQAQRTAAIAGSAQNRSLAIELYSDLLADIQQMRSSGQTFAVIADHLNAQGHTTRTGKAFHPATVKRILDRAPAPPPMTQMTHACQR